MGCDKPRKVELEPGSDQESTTAHCKSSVLQCQTDQKARTNDIEKETHDNYTKVNTWDPQNIIHAPMLERVAGKHIEMRNKLNELASTATAKQQRDDNMNRKTGLKARCRKVKGPIAAALLYVKRDKQGPQGQPKGQFTTNPTEIDGVAKRAWKKIYAGYSHNIEKTVDDFMKK